MVEFKVLMDRNQNFYLFFFLYPTVLSPILGTQLFEVNYIFGA